MRQVFSSPRIENVEAVARMLEDAGIEVRVNNGRSYRGAIRGNFSYREEGGGGPRPSVWVIRSDQQPEARRILREAGLLQSPVRGDSFLPGAPASSTQAAAQPARGAGRFRYGLLLAVAVTAALALLAWRAGRDDAGVPDAAAGHGPAVAPAPATQQDLPGMPEVAFLPEEAFTVATPPALATTLLRAELAAAGTTRGCLAIDGADPGPEPLRELAAAGLDVLADSACTGDRLAVSVSGYSTDGSGAGTVQVAVGNGDARTLAVRREGRDWLREPAP